jgi:hypothetical protein
MLAFEGPMTDIAFLDYVRYHSRTERHLFHRDDVERLLKLAEETEVTVSFGGIPGFVALDYSNASPLLDKALARLKKAS